MSVIIVQTAMANNVIASENNKVVSLQNEYVKVNFDLRDGCYQVVNVKENLICIDKAYAHVNDRKTTERPFAEGFSLTVAMVEPVFHIDYFVITQLFK
ncbi:MAG: hypothetical protein LBS59_02645 [Puniceicoccales bacterium]|nr:hypothetical protein [Puniceicoccales bacterium]